MKGTFIKSTKQLPEWFKLENYRKAEFFEAAEWHDELFSRFALREGATNYINDSIGLYRRWEFIKRDGLLFYSAKNENVCHRVFFVTPDTPVLKTGDFKEKEAAFLGVSSLSNMYVYASFLRLELEEQRQVLRRVHKVYSLSEEDVDIIKLITEDGKWANAPFDNFADDIKLGQTNKFAYARVKLNASDEQIKKDFTIWLESERRRRDSPAPKKNYSEHEINSWHDFSVLPYLDLIFWAESEKIKINQHVIAQAIFPDAYSVGSDSDPMGKLKTTKKKAESLMTLQSMYLLGLQS